ncbi:MAG: uroporphyrinogen decarboxylase family protein [Armatimonadota bacterium]|nr:uroporphyrinogen decarboxylase family protein [Armatimonadota bacterium]
MTRRDRLMATLRGEPVDRPPVSFYEIGGWKVDPNDPDPFNIYNHPSWRPLLELAESETDIIRMCAPAYSPLPGVQIEEFFKTETWIRDGSLYTRTSVCVGGRTLTSLTRRDPDVHTVWTIEHLLKTPEDAELYLQIPDEVFVREPDVSNLFEVENELGDRGIVMIDTADPICLAASLFSLADYTVIAFTEKRLFHQLLEKFARIILPRVEKVASEFPGRLWRICGPEYATEPYLPPELFREYVVPYTGLLVQAIQKHGGFARIHCHGRLKNVLPYIAEMGPAGLDPIEPPPQGDVELLEVRRQYGKEMVLFGNIEVSDIETMPPAEFEKLVAKTLRDGTEGEGRGFVLMPTAAPYGRVVSETTLANYRTMVRLAKNFSR